MIVLKTIDAHEGGQPLRLIIDGFPTPRGKTMIEKREWAARRADHVRRALMLEPRGHADMVGAVLTEPVNPGSHAGVLFMDNDRFGSMSGHGIIAMTTIAIERGLVMPGGDGRQITFDTPAGTVCATAHWATEVDAADTVRAEDREGTGRPRSTAASAMGGLVRVARVSFVNVPSFVLLGGVEVAVGSRRVRADISYGGAFYAVVDSESVGLPLTLAHLPELRRMGTSITRAVEATLTVAHPLEPTLSGMDATIFTSPPHSDSADLRSVAVSAAGAVDRSGSGTGTAAVMAILDAMGLLDDERPFVQESIIGTTISARLIDRTVVGECAAIVPQIQGSAWLTGEHTFVLDPADPLQEGFRL